MYLSGAQPDLLDTVNDKLLNRVATVDGAVPGIDPGTVRLLNIFVLGPSLLTAAFATKPLSKMVKVSLLVGGISTIVANYNKYKQASPVG